MMLCADIFASILNNNILSILNYDSYYSSANDTGSVLCIIGDTTDTQNSQLNMENINYFVNYGIYLLDLNLFLNNLNINN